MFDWLRPEDLLVFLIFIGMTIVIHVVLNKFFPPKGK